MNSILPLIFIGAVQTTQNINREDLISEMIRSYFVHRVVKSKVLNPEMTLLSISRILVDFNAQWLNVINEKSNSLLYGQNYLEMRYFDRLISLTNSGLVLIFYSYNLLMSLYCAFLDMFYN